MSLNRYIVYPPAAGGITPDGVLDILTCRDNSLAIEAALGSIHSPRIDNAQRRSTIQWLTLTPRSERLFATISSLAIRANEEAAWGFEIGDIGPRLQLTCYDAGVHGHFAWHIDVGPGETARRKISIVILLSEPTTFEGGALQFLRSRDPETPVLVAGSVVAFPSYLLHRVTPVMHGLRLSLVGWANGPRPFR